MQKSELRKRNLAIQKSLSVSERNDKSQRIAEIFFAGFNLSKINFLHCFLPIEKFKEINTKPIFEKLWQDFPHIKTVVPRVNFQTNEIENLLFSSETELNQNQWHIHEPLHDEVIETKQIDLVLVPLLAVDESGHRIGYGKGFYDRLLKHCRTDCLKIGLSYSAPVKEIKDAQEFDVRLDFCITPERIFRFEK